ncbi:MAG: alpha/beta fold hydrolase [Chloroflexota bacterium]|nr:alpha/beta fold hydrolase [Chloroflexota bacterium]
MPDARVQAAINNWAPRFIAQGVDYNDFFRTTARIERWDDWCREWCATADAHAALAARAQARGNALSAGEASIAAALCYHFARFLFQDHRDEYSAASRQATAAHARGLQFLDLSAERIEIPFAGATMVGILRLPRAMRRAPLVLLLPGLDSTKEEFFHWENTFLDRGMATFTLEGPGQGECQAPIRADYEVAVSAALDALTKRDDIDATRIGAAGVSLGGYYAMRAAAFEPRLCAVVENCGPFEWGECWDGLNELTRAAFQYHSGARDAEEARRRAQTLSLQDAAPRVRQPLLVIHGKQDRLIPWEQAQKIARAVGANAELALFENGSHVCNNIPYVYRPLTADWLKEQLG